jgi:hypothetical protein
MKSILTLNIYWITVLYIIASVSSWYLSVTYGAIVTFISIVSYLYIIIQCNILKHNYKNIKHGK